jgi:hypothetical protein
VVVVPVRYRVEADRAPCPDGRVLREEALLQQPRAHSDAGLAASLISKMQRSRSMRGTIRQWWKLAMIEAAPSPASARLRSAVVSDSNLC